MKAVLLTFAPVIVLLALAALGLTHSAVIAIGGWSQILGVGLVVFMVWRALEKYGAQSPQAYFRDRGNALKQRLMFWRSPQSQQVSGAASVSIASAADARLIHGLAPDNATIQEKVQAVEGAVRSLQSEVGQLVDRVKEDRDELIRMLKTEREHRKEEVANISRSLQDVAVGDTKVNLLGVAWILQGISFTTWPEFYLRLLA